MRLIDRAKNIVVSPKTEWGVIAAEATPRQALIIGYVLPLAAIAAVAAFIGQVFVGQSMGPLGTIRLSLAMGIVGLVFAIVMAVVMVFIVGFIIDALAPTFGAQKNLDQAIKVAAYSYTPVWLVGVLAIVPALGLLGIIAAIYAVYLLYLGLPRLMGSPPEKSAGYTALVVVIAIVVGIVVAALGGMITAPAMMGAGSAVTYDKDSALGKLDDLGRKMEEAGRKMDAAGKSGDPGKQMEAAMGALGAALSGGKGVEPVQLDALKPFLPEQLAGMPRTSMRTDRSGVAGLMAAKVEGVYGERDRRIELEVVDTGGAMGMMAIAAWAAVGASSERENDQRKESMRREGKRLVHEEISKTGGKNKYSVVLAERFMVAAEGRGIDIDTLKSAVSSIDLTRLEALK
jgi:hypothetical protein